MAGSPDKSNVEYFRLFHAIWLIYAHSVFGRYCRSSQNRSSYRKPRFPSTRLPPLLVSQVPDKRAAWDLSSCTMIRDPYEVSIVLDCNYGSRLQKLLESGPIWAIDSPANREVAQEIWTELPSQDHLDGITIFTAGKGASSEEAFIAEFDTIDMHHGVYSAVPPYTIVRVIGTFLNDKLKTVLSTYGFDSFAITEEGFRATRPLPSIQGR